MRAAQKIKSPITAGVAKVPVVMQMEALECGAASLAMILAYYEKWVPLEQVRLDCGVSRDGSNARNILRAARSYGLTAKGYRYEPEGLKANGKFPCIIHWNFNHFVVLNGFRGNKAVLNDPAKGTYSVPMQTFDDSFTGICLFFEPAEGFVPEGKPQSMLQYAKKRLVGAGTAIAFVTLTTVISSLLGIVTPAFSRIFLDRLLTGETRSGLCPSRLRSRASACFSSLSRGSRRSIPSGSTESSQWWEIPPFCGKSCTCRWRFSHSVWREIFRADRAQTR